MRIVQIVFLILVAFAAGRTVESGFTNFSGQAKPVEVSVLSESEAKKLFGSFVANKNIPFRYPIDGCYARATAMAQMAEKQKINMAKIYAEGYLVVDTNYEEKERITWGWHVAPIAYVKKASGDVEIQVFDPSLFNQPVSVEEWKKKMLATKAAKIEHVYMGARYQYSPRFTEGEKDRWLKEDVADMDRVMKEYGRMQFHERAIPRPTREEIPFPAVEGVQ